MKSKDETFSCFKKFLSSVQTQSEHKLKALRPENGGEYVSKEFTDFCSSRGIKREGFVLKGKEHLVCKLLKSLYGLKKSSRQWYQKFDAFMRSQGYKRSTEDPCLYVKRQPNGQLIMLILYVDDMLCWSFKERHC